MSFTAVKTTWNSFAKKTTREAFPLRSVLKNVNKVVLEAYKLSNLHILRCAQKNKDYMIDQKFYYNCLAAVSEQKLRKNNPPKDPELLTTLALYNSRKPEGYVTASKDYMGGLFSNAAQQMITMTNNYFAYTFNKRLYKYLRRRYILWSTEEIRSFINNVYNSDYRGSDPEVWKIKESLGYEAPFSQNVIPVLYRLLKFCEATKQRLFTLLPNRKTFTISYTKIDSTCLHDILISCKLMERDNNFITKKRDYWTKLFNVKKFETSTRSFAYEILTDGKAVSIILNKKKRPCESEVSIPLNYDVVWGLDPGRTNILTATNSYGDTCKVSTAEYYFDSKITEKNRRYSKWYKNDQRVLTAFRTLPSLKTTSVDQFMSYLDIFFKEVDYLLDFHFRKGFRDAKFKTYVFAQKKLHNMCKQLVNDNRTVVGFGDWSNKDSPVLRKPKGPVKAFKDTLKRYATVIDIDEYKTSKTCSCCHEEVEKTGVYTVLRCANTFCKRNLINRDQNAASNILYLVINQLEGRPRPACFMRMAPPIPVIGRSTVG